MLALAFGSRPVLALAFGLAGLLEVMGVALVLDDLRRERRAPQELIDQPLTEPLEFNAETMRLFPGSIQHRKRMLDQKNAADAAAEVGEYIRQVLIEFLRPRPLEWRSPRRWHRWRLSGPILIVIGIVIGTGANICAL